MWGWFFKIGKSVAGSIRGLIKWIARKVMGMLVWQLIFWIAGAGIGWMIINLQKDLAQAIHESNNKIVARIFKFQDFVFGYVHNIFLQIDALIEDIQNKILDTLSAMLPEQIELILTVINYAQWLDTLTSEIMDSMADAVRDTVASVSDPIAKQIEGVWRKIKGIYDSLQGVNEAIKSTYQTIVDSILAQQTIYNNNIIGSLFGKIDGAFAFINADVDTIRALVEAGEPVEWENFKYSAERFGISRTNYQLNLQIPPFPDIPALVTAIQELGEAADIIFSLHQKIESLPGNVRKKFVEYYPSFLRTSLEEKITRLLIIAITRALLEQREKIHSYFIEIRQKTEDIMVNMKTKIIEEGKRIRDAITEAELELINKLPDILRPALVKQVEKIKDQVIKSQEEILVNIDQVLMDTRAVDHIIERIKTYPYGPEPIKFDAAKWTLSDVYRILNHYFYKEERMALALLLMDQDLKIEAEQIKDMMAEQAGFDSLDEIPII